MSRASIWIVDPTFTRQATMGLEPGTHYYAARLVKNGPLVPVKTSVVEPRDEDGNLIGDVTYTVEVNGQAMPMDQWDKRALLAERRMTEQEYKTALADRAWQQSRGLAEDKPLSIMDVPVEALRPPGM